MKEVAGTVDNNLTESLMKILGTYIRVHVRVYVRMCLLHVNFLEFFRNIHALYLIFCAFFPINVQHIIFRFFNIFG